MRLFTDRNSLTLAALCTLTLSTSLVAPAHAGTTGRIAQFLTPTTEGDSVMFQSGTRIGVNTTAPFDTMHVVFNDASGAFTGYAVQNTNAAGFSGNLFYDHTGGLTLFQGYNNTTH